MTAASFVHNCASWGPGLLFRTHVKYFWCLSSDGGRDWDIQEWPRVTTLLFPQNWLDLLNRQVAKDYSRKASPGSTPRLYLHSVVMSHWLRAESAST